MSRISEQKPADSGVSCLSLRLSKSPDLKGWVTVWASLVKRLQLERLELSRAVFLSLECTLEPPGKLYQSLWPNYALDSLTQNHWVGLLGPRHQYCLKLPVSLMSDVKARI